LIRDCSFLLFQKLKNNKKISVNNKNSLIVVKDHKIRTDVSFLGAHRKNGAGQDKTGQKIIAIPMHILVSSVAVGH